LGLSGLLITPAGCWGRGSVLPDRKTTITAAVACVLVSMTVAPLFFSPLWFATAVGAVATAAGAGMLTRLRAPRVPPVLACLAAGVAALLLYLNLVFEGRHSLLYVIPTSGSLARLWDLAGAGLADAHRYHQPAPDLPGLILLAAAGVGITAVLTDLIAVRLRSAALAGLPLLVLFGVPVMMTASHHELVDSLVFCLAGAGYLAMLAVGSRAGGNAMALAAAGGIASIAVALGAPLMLSGVHLNTLFFSGTQAGGLPQTMAQLHETSPSVVFTYTTNASPSLQQNDPLYFQQYVFDTLGQTGWQPTSYPPGTAQTSSLPQPPGLTDLSAAQPVTTRVTTTGLPDAQPAFLPLPYPAIGVSVPGQWLADPDLMVYSPASPLAGITYSATSYAVDPSQAQLDAVPSLTGVPGLAPDLQLPPSYRTAALEQLARAQTSGQATEFGKVDALANWLSSAPFRYSLSATPFDSAVGLTSFLTTTKTGYCVQYAYAMTVLTRLLGIPARFVTGYTTGVPGKDGSYVVKTTDSHAWTEVYFPTFGWIRFEPTPGHPGGTASRPDYMSASTGTATMGSADPIIQATGSGSPSPAGDANRLAPKPSPHAGQPGLRPQGRLARTSEAATVLAVVAAIALAVVAPAALRIARRQWRWMRASDDVAQAHVAWREFRDDLTDFGFRGRPSEPPRALAARVSVTLPEPASAAVRRLALAEERVSYATQPVASQHLRRDSTSARRGLAATARRSTRWRARLLPASLLASITGAVAHLLHRN
jgi:transglutaminase-like putative cysteine protease